MLIILFILTEKKLFCLVFRKCRTRYGRVSGWTRNWTIFFIESLCFWQNTNLNSCNFATLQQHNRAQNLTEFMDTNMFRCLHLGFIADMCRLTSPHDAHSFIPPVAFITEKCKHSTHFCVQVSPLLPSQSPRRQSRTHHMDSVNIQYYSHSGTFLLHLPLKLSLQHLSQTNRLSFDPHYLHKSKLWYSSFPSVT